MCTPDMLLIAGTVMTTGATAVNAINQGRIADANARLMRVQAENAREVAGAKAQDQRLKTKALIGKQTAAFGASGGEINTGSSLNILADTAQIGEVDARRILVAGENRANALEFSADLTQQAGDAAKTTGLIKAAGTALTGGSQVASKWKVYKADNPGDSFTDFVLGN